MRNKRGMREVRMLTKRTSDGGGRAYMLRLQPALRCASSPALRRFGKKEQGFDTAVLLFEWILLVYWHCNRIQFVIHQI